MPNKVWRCGNCQEKLAACELVPDRDCFLICKDCEDDRELHNDFDSETILEMFGYDGADIAEMDEDEKADLALEELGRRNED